MGRPQKKMQCPICEDTGKDNLVLYEDGSGFCWSCEGVDGKFFSVKEMENVLEEGYEINDHQHSAHKAATPQGMLTGSCVDLHNRAITADTCRKYNYMLGKLSDKTVHIVPIYDQFKNMVTQQLRFPDKQMRLVGDASRKGLIGDHLFNPNPKLMVTVTEGALDMLSVAQSFQCRYPVVSVIHGAGKGAIADIKAKLEWLSKFKHVVLAFDNDEAGRLTTQAVVELFEPGKIKIAQWPDDVKDANDLLAQGRESEIRQTIMFAKDYIPDSIMEVEDLLDAALEEVEVGLSWPWESMTRYTFGIRLHELYTFGAGSGVGKTEVFKDVALHLAFKHDQPVAIISVEQPPKVTLQRLIGGMISKRIHIPGLKYDKELARKEGMKLKGKVSIWDSGKEGCEFEKVLNKIRFFVNGKGIKYIFLDHITAIAATIQGDERRGLDTIMSTLGKLVQELDCSIFLVSHLSKPSKSFNKNDPNSALSYEQGRIVTADAFRGSQSIQYYSTFLIGLERDKDSNDTCMTMRILKDRLSGESDGEALCVEYNRNTGKLEEL